MNKRIVVIAAASALAIAVVIYIYLQDSRLGAPADLKTLLEQIPTAAPTDPANLFERWPASRALGRYDNMQRSGDIMLGRWAANIRNACIASLPITSIPNEKSWKEPVNVFQCFDGATVFEINLEE